MSTHIPPCRSRAGEASLFSRDLDRPLMRGQMEHAPEWSEAKHPTQADRPFIAEGLLVAPADSAQSELEFPQVAVQDGFLFLVR